MDFKIEKKEIKFLNRIRIPLIRVLVILLFFMVIVINSKVGFTPFLYFPIFLFCILLPLLLLLFNKIYIVKIEKVGDKVRIDYLYFNKMKTIEYLSKDIAVRYFNIGRTGNGLSFKFMSHKIIQYAAFGWEKEELKKVADFFKE